MEKKIISVFLFVTVINVEFSTQANILGIFPSPSISHQVVHKRLMEALFERGHNVTLMTTDPDNLEYKQIDVRNISYGVRDHFVNTNPLTFPNNDSPVKAIVLACKLMLEVIDKQLGSPEMQNLIHSPNNTFDLIVMEGVFPIAPAFKKRFKCPVILVSTLGYSPNTLDEFGNPMHPVIFPDIFAAVDPFNSSIWQRFYLLIRHFGFKVYYYTVYASLFEAITKKHFGESITNVQVEGGHVSEMFFVNYHPIWHGAKPLVPAIIPMWNVHIRQPEPLPEELKKVLDESKKGVILFSFGTNIRTSQLNKDLLRTFTESFADLPYTVLWKKDADVELALKSRNVITFKWLPQLAILCHPNAKLFITQGGQQSVEESIHCKVPMLVLPLMFDQEANAFRVESHKIGKSLNANTITKDLFKNTIREIIDNPDYLGNITHFRELINDVPHKSLDEAVWWTEYVMRHNGANHLRSPAAQISMLKYMMIDLILVCFFTFWIVVRIVSFVKRKLGDEINTKIASKRSLLSSLFYYLIPIILGNTLIYIIYYL